MICHYCNEPMHSGDSIEMHDGNIYHRSCKHTMLEIKFLNELKSRFPDISVDILKDCDGELLTMIDELHEDLYVIAIMVDHEYYYSRCTSNFDTLENLVEDPICRGEDVIIFKNKKVLDFEAVSTFKLIIKE